MTIGSRWAQSIWNFIASRFGNRSRFQGEVVQFLGISEDQIVCGRYEILDRKIAQVHDAIREAFPDWEFERVGGHPKLTNPLAAPVFDLEVLDPSRVASSIRAGSLYIRAGEFRTVVVLGEPMCVFQENSAMFDVAELLCFGSPAALEQFQKSFPTICEWIETLHDAGQTLDKEGEPIPKHQRPQWDALPLDVSIKSRLEEVCRNWSVARKDRQPSAAVLLVGPAGSGKTACTLALSEAVGATVYHVPTWDLQDSDELARVFRLAEQRRTAILVIDDLHQWIRSSNDEALKSLRDEFRRRRTRGGLLLLATSQTPLSSLQMENLQFDETIRIVPLSSEERLDRLRERYGSEKRTDVYTELLAATSGMTAAEMEAFLVEAEVQGKLLGYQAPNGQPPFNTQIIDSVRQRYPSVEGRGDDSTAEEILEDEDPGPRRRGASRKQTHSTIQDIMYCLESSVVGQSVAKRALSVVCAQHRKRIANNTKVHRDVEIEKTNIVLIGPTGCGKTLVAKTLAKAIQVPFVVYDCSRLTETGYVGPDVEEMFSALVIAAGGDIAAAQRGVIFLDEFDKLAKQVAYGWRDISGQSVQMELLKLIEGTTCSLTMHERRHGRHGTQANPTIDTTNILFICGGVFDGINQVVERRLGTGGLGFHRGKANPEAGPAHPIPEDLVALGFMPELVGRLSTVVRLDPLDEGILARILTEPKNALVRQYQTLLAEDGIDLLFADSAIREIARRAFRSGFGARGLRTILEELLRDLQFEARPLRGRQTIEVAEEAGELLLRPIARKGRRRPKNAQPPPEQESIF